MVVGTLAVPAAPALGQQANSPHAGFAYPAGGRQGTTVQVMVGGRNLEGVSGAVFSGRGVKAEIAGYDKPLAPREIQDLRDKAQELQKGTMTPETRRQLFEMRDRLGDSLRRLSNPVLAESVTLTVTVDADAEPGPWQLRLVTPLGLSNPVAFSVSQLPEVVEAEPAAGADAAAGGPAGRAGARGAGRGAQQGPEQAPPPPEPPQRVTLPVVINGRIIPSDPRQGAGGGRRQANQYAPGDADRYVFEARKGQDLVVAVSARDVMPYLADAVPGWFQATVALVDAAGREVAYVDDHRFQPDPVLHYRVPGDGDYTVEIKDAIFRGREDFVYRISIGDLPYVTGIFPLGGPARAKTAVQVAGWNLPTGTVTMDASGAGPGTATLTVRRGALVSNRVPFAVDSLRDAEEGEPNDAPKAAPKLAMPIIVNGRIQSAGDVDVFAIAGRAGEQVVAEITARRLGSPLDSVIELTDASGARIAVSDDAADKGAGLITHQADSRILAVLPASGTYYLRVGDLQRKGGAEYRLPAARRRAAAGFRRPGDARGDQRRRGYEHRDHGTRDPEGRVRGRHRPVAEGRPSGVHAERRRRAGGAGPRAPDHQRSADAARGTASHRDRRARLRAGQDRYAPGAGGRRDDAGIRLPAPRARRQPDLKRAGARRRAVSGADRQRGIAETAGRRVGASARGASRGAGASERPTGVE